MDAQHEFWVEEVTGAVWAVEVCDDVVAACYGPLTPGEVDEELLETYEYASGGVAWINESRQRFSSFVPVIPYISPT